MPAATRRRTKAADDASSQAQDASSLVEVTNAAVAKKKNNTKSSQSTDGDDDKAKSTIVFFHPDLGIGGAERLVVDAAVGLQSRGYKVVIFTNHCDPGHCFDECRDGTLDVRVRADFPIPMSLFSRLTILCAILRHLQLLLTISLTGELRSLCPTALIADQLSAGLPFLRTIFCRDVPILFYCHFPDLLLAQGRQESLSKRLYRVPFDWLEQWSMGFAQAVAVNSEFTKGVVRRTWPGLQNVEATKVVYPCVDIEAEEEEDTDPVLEGEKILLSINRFERKKDIALAIKAFAAIPEADRKGVRLLLAGGYDPRVSENVEYHTELQSLATSLSLTHDTLHNPATLPSTSASSSASSVPPPQVLFLLSIPGALKTRLLRSATLLLYTPSNEHFGIVPLEAMLARVPVLAANTGGPVETVVQSETGWLCDPTDVPAWTEVIGDVLSMSSKGLSSMGSRGAERVKSTFGRDSMAERLDDILRKIWREERMLNKDNPFSMGDLVGLIAVLGCLLMAIVISRNYWWLDRKYGWQW